MLIIDTGPAFLDAGLKSNNEEDVRRFFAPLRAMAERLRMVVIVLAHLNKDTTRSSGQRIMGGAAWRNVPRQVLLVGPPPGEDPRETGERLVAVEKNNYGMFGTPAVAFRLAPAPGDPSRAVVVWGNEVSGIRASDLVGALQSGEERADLLGVEHKTIRRLIDREELPALRVGRLLRIDPADLEALRYRPASSDPGAPTSRPRPRPARGEFSRRARELPTAHERG